MPRSLAFQTDVALRRNEGSLVQPHAGYTVIRSPENPTFFWGNFLLMPAAPQPGDRVRWEALFTEQFPHAAHRTFGLDTRGEDPDPPGEWSGAGYDVRHDTVLTAEYTVPPARVNREAQFRPVHSPADWQAALDLRMAVNAADPHGYDPVAYRPFVERKLAAYRAVQASGRGALFAAFDGGGSALSSLGIFDAGGGVARYQSVETHPDHRSRGLAGTLVHAAGEWARTLLGTHTLVIVADPGYHAQALYERVGFRPTERQISFEKRPPGA